jgi:hypothetical protein
MTVTDVMSMRSSDMRSANGGRLHVSHKVRALSVRGFGFLDIRVWWGKLEHTRAAAKSPVREGTGAADGHDIDYVDGY